MVRADEADDERAWTGPRRHLIVANVTLASADLRRAVQDRCELQPSTFHVVVPCPSSFHLDGIVLGDPMTGFVTTDIIEPRAASDADLADAQHRLEHFVAAIGAASTPVTGEVGPSDPIRAVASVLATATFDEIIVSTLPHSLSRWLRIDLPRRLRRLGPTPVTHVEATTHLVG
jgi:hypothetical protein